MAHVEEASALSGNVTTQFARFVFPSVFGLLAVSSAGVIDAIFVGNFVGSIALASVNLTTPLLALVFGVILMISLGGAVAAGKFLGENNYDDASNTYTKTCITLTIVMILLSVVVLCMPAKIVSALGAMGETIALSAEYVWVIAWFFPAFGYAVWLSQFTRADGRPVLSFLGLLVMTLTNIIFDYTLIAWLEWGLTGAALATGLSFLSAALYLLAFYRQPQADLKLIRPYGPWMDVLRSSYNGFSEFVNEASSGLILLMFNWILMTQIGALGVAAFTIVDYVIYFGILVFYGVSEGLVPLISVNFGGRKPDRIVRFVLLAAGLNVLTGIVVIACLFLWPVNMISMFLKDDESDIIALAVSIIAIIWPMFLFNGANIAVSAYFTGMQCARQSATIAILRSLVLPVALILLFWKQYGFMGAFYALPISEAITFCVAVFLLKSRLPRHILR